MDYKIKYLKYKEKYLNLKLKYEQTGGSKTRPSPTESATLFSEGTKKRGNDGNMYVISVDKNGRNRWVKTTNTNSKPKNDKKQTSKLSNKNTNNKKYKKINFSDLDGYEPNLISWNMTVPYISFINNQNNYAIIAKSTKKVNFDYTDEINYELYDSIITEFEFDKLFIPKGYELSDLNPKNLNDKTYDDGNTLLFKKENNYLFAGKQIYVFNITDDEIYEYFSPIGPNAVPYPVAFGKKYIYFLHNEDRKRVPINYFKSTNLIDKINAYSIFYYGNNQMKPLKKHSEKFKVIKEYK